MLCEEVEGDIDFSLKTGLPLSATVRERVIQNCEELRLQIMALMLLGSAPNRSDQILPGNTINRLVTQDDEPSPIGPIHHGMGGLTWANVTNSTVILFPRFRSPEQCVDIIAELLGIYEDAGADSDWVIDFSGIDSLPVMVLGSLLAYQKKLASHDRKVYLAWVQPDLLPREAMKSFSRIFRLHNVGGHLFSERKKAQ